MFDLFGCCFKKTYICFSQSFNNITDMRELKRQFVSKGVEYTQLYKDDEMVIYQAKANHYGVNDIYYEVFNYRVSSMNPMSTDYDPEEKVEVYPRDKAFGYWAWCCSDWKCVAKVLRNHYDYNDETIRNLAKHNPKLEPLMSVLDVCEETLNFNYY